MGFCHSFARFCSFFTRFLLTRFSGALVARSEATLAARMGGAEDAIAAALREVAAEVQLVVAEQLVEGVVMNHLVLHFVSQLSWLLFFRLIVFL